MSKKYSDHAYKVINYVKRINDEVMKPEHLISGILHVEDCDAFIILKRYLSSDEINAIKSQYPIDNEIEFKGDKKASTEVHRVLKESSRISDAHQHEFIKTEHILLALSKLGFLNIKYTDLDVDAREIRSDITSSLEEKSLPVGNIAGGTDEPTSTTSDTKKGETPVLDSYSVDLTQAAKDGRLDPVIGREKETLRLAQILVRRKKNNPILVGEAGCGKTAIVEGLATMIFNKTAPEVLHDKRIVMLDLTTIVAGTKFRGQFEERLTAIIKELKINTDVIVFIDEIHTMIGAGNGQGTMDAANILKPALARGEFCCIGATTFDEYKKIEKDAALDRRFQKITVNSPSLPDTIIILNNLKRRYEDHHLVKFTDDAIRACATLSDKYISSRAFPDKAIDVMDEAGAAMRISFEMPQEIKEYQSNLDDILKLKKDAVANQQFQLAADYRSKEKELEALITESKANVSNTDRKVIDYENIAEVVSIMTGIPSNTISDDDSNSLINLSTNMKAEIIGQDKAVDTITKSVIRNKAGLNVSVKPIGVFMFLGTTGIGKTHIAKTLAKELFNDVNALIRIDMSEYMEKHSISRLIGAPAGYVGYDDGGILSDAVRNKPYAIILLDEVEKAHRDVWNIFLQVFDDGRLTDNQGRVIDFRNTIIIMTSNCGASEAKQRGEGVGFNTGSKPIEQSLGNHIIQQSLKKQFAPEFLNRIDDIIIFEKLGETEIKKIVKLELDKFCKSVLKTKNITVNFDESAIDFIIKKGWDVNNGARPLKRAIQHHIEDEMSMMLITKKIQATDNVSISHDGESSELSFSIINLISPIEDIKAIEIL